MINYVYTEEDYLKDKSYSERIKRLNIAEGILENMPTSMKDKFDCLVGRIRDKLTWSLLGYVEYPVLLSNESTKECIQNLLVFGQALLYRKEDRYNMWYDEEYCKPRKFKVAEKIVSRNYYGCVPLKEMGWYETDFEDIVGDTFSHHDNFRLNFLENYEKTSKDMILLSVPHDSGNLLSGTMFESCFKKTELMVDINVTNDIFEKNPIEQKIYKIFTNLKENYGKEENRVGRNQSNQ